MYDSLGRTLRIRQPEQEVNTTLNTSGDPYNNSWTGGFTYDNNGNVLTTTDAKGTTITSTYDALNRPLTRTYNDSPQTATVTNTYGTTAPAIGKLIKVSSSVSETQYSGFDVLGRLTESKQITPLDGETLSTAPVRTSSYQYNLSGALIQQTYPSGRVVETDLDASGDIEKITGRATSSGINHNFATAFSYLPDGKIASLKLGNGLWEAAKVNSRLQVTEIAMGHSIGDGTMMKLNYDYGELQSNGTVDATQNAGNIAKQTVTFSGLPNPFVQTYKYDSLDRITEAIEKVNGTQTWKQTFGFDRYGNRDAFYQKVGATELTINSTTLPSVEATTNRFSASQGFSYDKNGNITADPMNSGRTFVFNGDNKQTEVKNSSDQNIGTYYYDGNGKRVKKVTNAETTVFVYDGMGKIVAEYSTATPPSNPTVNYTATDQLGSPRVLTNAIGEVVSRRDFLPFGEELFADTSNRTTARKYSTTDQDSVRQRFTGYQKDTETSLDFAEARMYQNQHGRFTAVDPLLASGKSADPQTFNRYVYTMNRPLMFVDTLGLQAATPAPTQKDKDAESQKPPNPVPQKVPDRDPSYNCMAWSLGITDQWISPNYLPSTGVQQPGFIVRENRTGPGTGKPTLMPPMVSANDRPLSMTEIAKYYGADESVKVKGEGKEKDRKVTASATSEAVDGQYKIVDFESKDVGKVHVMRQEADGTWSSKNGEGKLETGIKDPEAYYQKSFDDPNAKANYLYREKEKLGKKQ